MCIKSWDIPFKSFVIRDTSFGPHNNGAFRENNPKLPCGSASKGASSRPFQVAFLLQHLFFDFVWGMLPCMCGDQRTVQGTPFLPSTSGLGESN